VTVTAPRPTRQPAQAFIFVTLMFDTMGMGIGGPVLPDLVRQMTGGDAARVAEVFGIFGTLFFVGVFFGAPLQGAISDSFGRRRIILISCVVTAIDYLIVALAPNLGWLYVGRSLVGIAAGNIAAVFSYLIDITPAEDRIRMFSFAGAAANVGTAVGPLIGGVAGTYNIRLPFWIAAGFCLINAVYGLFILPESLPPEKRAVFAWRNVNPLSAMIGVLRDYPVMVKWFAVIVLANAAVLGVNSIFPVYTTYRYDWSRADLSYYLTFFSLWALVLQAVLVPVMTRRFKQWTLFLIGSAFQAGAIVLCGLSPYWAGYVGFASAWAFGMVLMSASVNAMLSADVGDSDQGRVQGAARSLTSLVGLFAPGLFALILAWAIRFGGKALSGLPYIASGVLFVLATLVVISIYRPKPQT